MWAALGMQVGSALLGQGLNKLFEEEMDWSALNEQTTNVIGSLQKTFDTLTAPGGGFDTKEALITKPQDAELDKTNMKYSTVAKKAAGEGKALIASTGFAKSGVAENKVTDTYSNISEEYASTMSDVSLKHETQDYEFDMQKFETLAELEKEMNQILGQYAGTTGQRFGGQRAIEGLDTAMGGLI